MAEAGQLRASDIDVDLYLVGAKSCHDARTITTTFVSALLGAGMAVQHNDIVVTERSANIPVQLKGSDGEVQRFA